MKIKLHGLVVLLMALFLFGCSEQKSEEKPVSAVPAQQQPELTTRKDYELPDPNFLRSRMPDSALAYIRLPHLFGYLSAPKGDVFTPVLQRPEHVQIVNKIRDGLKASITSELGEKIEPLLALWMQHAIAPVEMMVMANKDKQPLPKILMATQLGFNTATEFDQFLQAWVKREPAMFMLTNEIAELGYARVAVGPMSIVVHFDAQTKLFKLHAGLGVLREDMEAVFASLVVNGKHPMLSTEAKIDAGLQGLFVWMNIENTMPILATTMPPAKYEELQKSMVGSGKTFGAGMGVSEGKGRLKFIMDLTRPLMADIAPLGQLHADFYSSGIPSYVVGMSIPDGKTFSKLEQHYLKQLPPGDNGYTKFMQEFEDVVGYNLKDYFSAIGPDMFALNDELGDFIVTKVRDRKLYQDLMKKMFAYCKCKDLVTDVDGVKIHHVRVPYNFLDNFQKKNPGQYPGLKLLQRLRSHSYWIEEQNYLVFASVPQLLVERSRYKARVKVADWLKKTQRQNTESALLLFSGGVKYTPTRLYYAYLQMLSVLADIAGVEIDLLTMPMATELELPETGGYGAQINISKQQFSAELVYEQNPVELVLGQNMSSVAVVGIVAAIAIPAYNDYTVRARVAGEFFKTDPVRQWVHAYWTQHGRFPNADEINKFYSQIDDEEFKARLTIEANTGVMTVKLQGHAQIDGLEIKVKPLPGKHSIDWYCEGDTLAKKYLPRSCR